MAGEVDYIKKLTEVTTNQSINEQAHTFLHAFVLEFQGKFEEVLDLAADFKKYIPKGKEDSVKELDEFQAHLFLEHRAGAVTVKHLREQLEDIDLDKNHKLAFIEFALFHFKKTLKELFTPPVGVSQELLDALDKAIAEYEIVLNKRRQREEKMAQLQALADAGGVKGGAAKHELATMLAEDKLAQNKAEVSSDYKKRQAEQAVANDSTGEKARQEALKKETARLAEEQRLKEEAEVKARTDSKSRLAAKASLWEQKK